MCDLALTLDSDWGVRHPVVVVCLCNGQSYSYIVLMHFQSKSQPQHCEMKLIPSFLMPDILFAQQMTKIQLAKMLMDVVQIVSKTSLKILLPALTQVLGFDPRCLFGSDSLEDVAKSLPRCAILRSCTPTIPSACSSTKRYVQQKGSSPQWSWGFDLEVNKVFQLFINIALNRSKCTMNTDNFKSYILNYLKGSRAGFADTD